MGADALDEVHDVAGEDHGATGLDETGEDATDRRGRDRVDGLERLVEHQHPRCVDERRGQRTFLVMPAE